MGIFIDKPIKLSAFSSPQWYDALKAVARLPTGIPKEWRNRVCCSNHPNISFVRTLSYSVSKKSRNSLCLGTKLLPYKKVF